MVLSTFSESPFTSSVLGGDYIHLVHLATATAFISLLLWLLTQLTRKASRKLPPGPKGLPLIGNIRHASDIFWLSSPERKTEYGEMMYVSVFGKGGLVLNSQRVAVDLLEKRSGKYSDRPRNIVLSDYMTKGQLFVFEANNDLVRRSRRAAFDSGFSKSGVSVFRPVQNREALTLALDLVKSSSQWGSHLRRHTLSIMLSINYQLPPAQSESDPLHLAVINDQLVRILQAAESGTPLVELLPFLRYVPSRFAKWKREAQVWYTESTSLFERLANNVPDDKASFVGALVNNQRKYNLTEPERAWLAGSMLLAGGATTSSILEWWFLAMLAHPDVQARAHAELDKVVGHARPPTFDDLPSLPYVRAIVKEVLRWAQIAPFGIPHVSTADDWYEGMFIPKGTICLPNMRLINADPSVYGEDAMRFNPDRHLDDGGAEKMGEGGSSNVFGFGRRTCVGRYIAEGTVGIDIATLLWAMHFERPKGAQGDLDTETFVLEGISAHPVPFEMRASPRFPETETLIVDALELYK